MCGTRPCTCCRDRRVPALKGAGLHASWLIPSVRRRHPSTSLCRPCSARCSRSPVPTRQATTGTCCAVEETPSYVSATGKVRRKAAVGQYNTNSKDNHNKHVDICLQDISEQLSFLHYAKARMYTIFRSKHSSAMYEINYAADCNKYSCTLN